MKNTKVSQENISVLNSSCRSDAGIVQDTIPGHSVEVERETSGGMSPS